MKELKGSTYALLLKALGEKACRCCKNYPCTKLKAFPITLCKNCAVYKDIITSGCENFEFNHEIDVDCADCERCIDTTCIYFKLQLCEKFFRN